MTTPTTWALNVRDYGAAGDARVISDGVMTTVGSVVHLTSASAPFTSYYSGKTITVVGGLTSSGTARSLTRTMTYVSASEVTLGGSATSVVLGSGFTAVFGTDDTSHIQAALTAAGASPGGNRVEFPPGNYLVRSINGNSPSQYALSVPDNVTLSGVRGASRISCYDTGGRIFAVAGTAKVDASDVLADANWVVRSSATSAVGPTIYATTPIPAPTTGSDGSYQNYVTLRTTSEATNFSPGMWVIVRTGERLGTGAGYRQPDCEINQIAAVNASSGQLTLRFPLAKPYDQEIYPSSGPLAPTILGSASWSTNYRQVPSAGAAAPLGVSIMQNTATPPVPAVTQNVHFQDLTFDQPPDGTCIVFLLQTYNVSMQRCDVLSFGTFIIGGRYSRDIAVRDNTVYRPVIPALGITAEDFRWFNAIAGFTHLLITRNHFCSAHTARLFLSAGTADVQVTENVFEQTPSSGGATALDAITIAARSYDVRFTDNVLINGYSDSGSRFISVDSDCVAGGLIARNVFRGSTGGYATNIAGSYWLIADNEFPSTAVWPTGSPPGTANRWNRNIHCAYATGTNALKWENN